MTEQNGGSTLDGDKAAERMRINAETARIRWRELQRFFAKGHAIYIDESLDLVEVALQMQSDNQLQVQQWITGSQIGPVTDAQALQWIETDTVMWCVVVKPWVLVQVAADTAQEQH